MWDSLTLHKESGTFNYDVKYKGTTAKSLSSLEQDEGLSNDGVLLNNKRVLLGSGVETFEKSKAALKSWRYFYMCMCACAPWF
ncbi:hypothetical protein AAHE18_13G003600 [Arachis hypogaea]|uniref:Uncharacterized protein n=1 Tax=Arachis hypogaea TaxID=3818 RepID=A0A445ABH5_ARAHY|nr:hypothetical protein Ahy_B03g068831 [Arachis hypogaea]